MDRLEGNMQEKKCTKCGEIKDVSEFYKKRKNKSGLCPWCKNCEKKRYLLWYKNNFQRVIDNANKWKINNKEKREEILSKYYNNNKEKIKKRSKGWSLDNKISCKQNKKKYYQNNTEIIKNKSRLWYENNKERHYVYHCEWKKNNLNKYHESVRKCHLKIRSTANGKLNHSISSGIYSSLAKGTKAGRHWETLVDYTIDQLRNHLEKQFKPGMTWENYGQWHLDHKVPLSVHNFQSPEDIDFKQAWALKNLQPLWSIENIKKSNKLTKPFQPSLTL